MMRLLLLLTLIATQSLGEVDSSGTYGAEEQSPSGDVSREAKSDGFLGTSASTGEDETPLSNSTDPLFGQSPANLNGSRRRSPGSPGAPPLATPCEVKDFTELFSCLGNPILKGKTLAAQTPTTLSASELHKKTEINSVAMRMVDNQVITQLHFNGLTLWADSQDADSLIENNSLLASIQMYKLKTLSAPKMVIVRHNPVLKEIIWSSLVSLVAIKGVYVTKNPTLEELTSKNKRSDLELTIRGNRNLKDLDDWPGAAGSSVRNTEGECGFWEPVKSLTELDGCQEVYEDLEFAPYVTDSTGFKISKIDGDLKIVGTDLANLDFFDFKPTDGVEVTGTVSFSDNLGICDRDFVFSKQTHRTDCPTTTSAPTTEPSTTVDVSTTVAGGGVPGGGPVPATSPAPPASSTGGVVLLLTLLATGSAIF